MLLKSIPEFPRLKFMLGTKLEIYAWNNRNLSRENIFEIDAFNFHRMSSIFKALSIFPISLLCLTNLGEIPTKTKSQKKWSDSIWFIRKSVDKFENQDKKREKTLSLDKQEEKKEKLYNIVFCFLCVIRCPADWKHMIYQKGKKDKARKTIFIIPETVSLEDKLS